MQGVIIVPEGFDFAFLPEGEMIVDSTTHEIDTVNDNDLRIQLAYNRVKSISNDWYIDKIGADLEELVGQPCTTTIVEYGKEKIYEQLTYDNLWHRDYIHIQSVVNNNTNVTYAIFLRIFDETAIEDSYVYKITAELDLVKGVFIRFGWQPKRKGWFHGIKYV